MIEAFKTNVQKKAQSKMLLRPSACLTHRSFLMEILKDEINYEGILVAGRNSFLDESKRKRLEWRSKNVVINSRHVHFFNKKINLKDIYNLALSNRLGKVSNP